MNSDKERELLSVFEDAVEEGLSGDYFGSDGNCFKLGARVFHVIEDEIDGYRSSLGAVQIHSSDGLIFLNTPLDRVTVRRVTEGISGDGPNNNFYQLLADDGHVWLEFGTANTDDYYPFFVFRTNPRPPP